MPSRIAPPQEKPEPDVMAQALIGAALYDDLEFHRSAGGETVESDLSQLPLFGIAGQQRMLGESLQLGFEAGALVSWRRDDARVVTTGGGSTVVLIDNELWLADLFAGVYLAAAPGSALRPYVGAGPLMMFGELDTETEVGDRSESEFGVGWYGRAGVEFRLGDGSYLGIGGRYLDTELDFDQGLQRVQVDGWQAMLTFTQGF